MMTPSPKQLEFMTKLTNDILKLVTNLPESDGIDSTCAIAALGSAFNQLLLFVAVAMVQEGNKAGALDLIHKTTNAFLKNNVMTAESLAEIEEIMNRTGKEDTTSPLHWA